MAVLGRGKPRLIGRPPAQASSPHRESTADGIYVDREVELLGNGTFLAPNNAPGDPPAGRCRGRRLKTPGVGSSRKVEDDRDPLAQLGEDGGADVAAAGHDPPRRNRTKVLALGRRERVEPVVQIRLDNDL